MNTTDELDTLTRLLDLDGFHVVEAAPDRGRRAYHLTVVPKVTAGLCPHCGRVTDERHACHDRDVVDLPLGGRQTELTVRVWQFRCAACDRFFTPRHAALAEGAHATERFLDRLADLATHADVSMAARFLGVAQKTAERWYYDHLERRRRDGPAAGQALRPIESLGIDELSLKKGTASSSAC